MACGSDEKLGDDAISGCLRLGSYACALVTRFWKGSHAATFRPQCVLRVRRMSCIFPIRYLARLECVIDEYLHALFAVTFGGLSWIFSDETSEYLRKRQNPEEMLKALGH